MSANSEVNGAYASPRIDYRQRPRGNERASFRGTRVPLKNLLDYIEGGYPLAEFLEDFATVSRAMAVQALEDAKDSLLARIA
jgi:uncharacterized protein (DUF433 family)